MWNVICKLERNALVHLKKRKRYFTRPICPLGSET